MAKKQTARTQRELAKAVGRDVSAVNRWIHDPGWPFGASGPWDVAKVKAWAGRNLRQRPSGRRGAGAGKDGGPLRRAETAEKLARTRLLQFQLAVKKGELHPADECRDRRVRQVRKIRDDLLALPDELEPTIGREKAGILRERIRAMLKALSEGR